MGRNRKDCMERLNIYNIIYFFLIFKILDRNILFEIIIEIKKNGSMYVCVWGVFNREIIVYKLFEGWKRKMGIWGILIWEEKEFVNIEGDGNSKK